MQKKILESGSQFSAAFFFLFFSSIFFVFRTNWLPMTQGLVLYVNGERHTPRDVCPETTLLQYLRAQGLTGTKLVCGEMGCGACTVYTARVRPGGCVAKAPCCPAAFFIIIIIIYFLHCDIVTIMRHCEIVRICIVVERTPVV
eukprot:TRINITY_DN513_c1_g1_i3.p1 TRINITY_DN513_c1_g1~~TRINITY_DN513_c1_g1_i3.p1  ORF type:complete len:143 (-),score=33.61 TRINITY_DN513_c1_g1_i3:189-617(-)